MVARSMMVRTGVVIGMPRWVVVSVGGERAAAVDADAAAAFAAGSPGTVTWMAPAPSGRRAQASAAVLWLSTASLPAASTAAIQRPSRVSTG